MLIDDGGVFVAGLINKGGWYIWAATGVFFWIFNAPQQQWVISRNIGESSLGYLSHMTSYNVRYTQLAVEWLLKET